MSTNLAALTLDQLRLFVCVAREGSFSAAARRLHRAQSAVSYGVANLEKLLAVQLFDRSGHRPTLTETGRSLLTKAQQVLDAVGQLQARAASVSEGLELDVHIAVDAICPAELLIELAMAFQEQFPTVSLRIQTDVFGAVAALVLDGTCQIGISGPIGSDSPGIERRYLADIAMVPVVAPTHPLADVASPISRVQVQGQVQIAISQRAGAATTDDRATRSGTTWHVADAATKLGLIRAGLGWGMLPVEMVRDDLTRGELVRLVLKEWGPEPLTGALYAITRSDAPPGRAGQWLLGRLETLSGQCPQLDGRADA